MPGVVAYSINIAKGSMREDRYDRLRMRCNVRACRAVRNAL